MKKAELIFRDKRVDGDKIVEMTIWKVPNQVKASTHFLKYSLYFGKKGERIVGYDNERGKGDHRHYRDHQEPYTFVSVEQLIDDFIADVTKEREND
ncbi:MAG: hypothetical protein JKY34_00320 [Kordiimonadaceae bacterium]|nr:hypothetical protein [Kordiimonadaceae bacterium]